MPGCRYVPLALVLLAGCMEQPKPDPLPRSVSLYTRLGGEEKLTALVERFAEKAAAARRLSEPVRNAFTGEDAETVKRRLVEQLAARLGGPYEALSPGTFAAALKGHVATISPEDHKALTDLLASTLREGNLGERLLDEVNKALLEAA